MTRLPLLLAVLWLAPPAGATPAFSRSEEREPCGQHDPLRRPFFGDLHVHTGLSLDAATQGTRVGPGDAYAFARGERLGIQPHDAQGKPQRWLQLARPLDFAAVTDHAELFGELSICRSPELPGHDAVVCHIYRRWPRLAFYLMNSRSSYSLTPERYDFCGPGARDCLRAARTPWQQTQAAAEAAYDRSGACAFTSFVGYEWTGGPGSNNIHRNVLYRNASVPPLPVSYYEQPSQEGLWQALLDGCAERGEGCDVLTIPHNSNISGGLLFQSTRSDGTPLDAAGARRRARMEPLVEVMQHKGDSECRTGVGTEDEHCRFEVLPYHNFQSKFVPFLAEPPGEMNFLRNVLKQGLVLGGRLGVNPFRFGLIASTDTHLGAAGYTDERRHPGHGGAGTPASQALAGGLPDDVEFNPGGLAVLWAEENSRDALFAAMRRGEAYGTSGPRMLVRSFAGFELPEDLCTSPDFVRNGYAKGVPMGGTLQAQPNPAARPRIAVWALRDPGTAQSPSATLSRVQIVKGWVEQGRARERVVDVARSPGAAGVDPASCALRGQGADQLCGVWSDPDFDPAQPAFYYARVLEVPTCRWHTWLCLDAGVDCADPDGVASGFEACCDEAVPKTLQERAWTSPIWWTPPD